MLKPENILEHVIPVLGNKERNKHRLEKISYREWEDLVISYKVVMANGEENASMTVSPEILKVCGLTEEEIHAAAMANLSKTSVVLHMRDILSEMLGEELEEELDAVPMLVCGSKTKTYGAAAMLLPEVQEEVHKKIGNFYVLPSSVHEVICVPGEDADECRLRGMVHKVNCTEVQVSDFLSDNIYYYDGKKLSVV